MPNFVEKLTGGHPNSLGNTIAVVDEVLEKNELFDELFNCYFSEDEIVRLRTSNAVRRVTTAQPELVIPYLDRLLQEISLIDQASTKWTLAKLFQLLEKRMSKKQKQSAKKIMQKNLTNEGEEQDWIVLNNTMETLTEWSQEDDKLKEWLLPHLKELKKDRRRSVAGRAAKFEKQLLA